MENQLSSELRSFQLLAISTENDGAARGLAASYGALVLLDKMKHYGELIPAIMKFALTASGPIRYAICPTELFLSTEFYPTYELRVCVFVERDHDSS
jgi:hypothetical protein